MLKLEKQYQVAKEEFGVIGNSCYFKKEIEDKSLIWDKWEELKKTYLY